MAPTIDSQVKLSAHDLPTPDPDSPLRPRKPYRFSTLCATVENPSQKDQYGSSSVPIYQTATFKGVDGQYDYTRSGNPTRSHLEHHIAKISSASHAFAVSSGMAALDVILRMLKPGDEVIAGDDIYGGTNRLLTYIRTHGGITVHHVNTSVPESLIPVLNGGKTAMVLLESPTNPLLKIVDIARISAMVKERAPNAIVVADNTMMSPYLQRPLEHGADIVYDSATKYLSGHHDLMAGAITCNREDLAKHMAFTINSVGNALSPIDSFLLLRGTKTLAIRLDRQQATANAVAMYLHSLGFPTNYPGLPSHPGRDIHEAIADGPGAVLSFSTGDKALSERIIGGTRLWGISVSFGCVNSLISMPCAMSHASIDAATRAARGLPEDLIRLCVGIEDPGDLLDDLERALLEAGAIKYDHSISKFVRVDPREIELAEAVAKLEKKRRELEPEEPEEKEWFISSPGKIILFGEHAVVHGVTAVAASVDLRCYALTTPRNDKKISVHFADIDSYYAEWNIADLPWSAMAFPPSPESNSAHPEELDIPLLDAIANTSLNDVFDKKHARTASLAFLYIYMMIARSSAKRPSFNFTARSTLPVGAGLGSSASFSVCVSTSILLLFGRISVPAPPAPAKPGANGLAHIHVSHQGRRALPPALSAEVNNWAFVSEKVLHGNPSGVDNSVAVYGGALSYTRAGFGKKSGMDPIHGFKSLKFLLTNSKVPRDTKKLVAGVAQLKAEQPEFVNNILEQVQSIVDEARRALLDPEMPRGELITALTALINENHEHLVNLGVSHPSLEAIRKATGDQPFGLSTKLTGAGGGGCSLTLLPDEIEEDKITSLLEALSNLNFEPYLTSVGGSGLGILSPYEHHRNTKISRRSSVEGQFTPPETPGGDLFSSSLRPSFEMQNKEELKNWVHDLGRWLYV